MSVNELDDITDIVERMDSADGRPARFSYTEDAFTNDDIEGVASFSLSQDQNVPLATLTDYADEVLDRGARTQGASIPRMGWDHFIGRFSYNLAKLTQKIFEFLGLVKSTWAHNAFEYDVDQEYAEDDVCYIVGTSGGVDTIAFYIRTSSSPLLISGVSPVAPGQSDWEPMQDYNSIFPQLPINAPGYQQSFSLVDLSNTGVYAANTWFPVVSEPLQAALVSSPQDHNTILTKFEAYVAGAVSGQAHVCRASLSALARTSGWNVAGVGDTAAYPTGAVILSQEFIDATDGTDLGNANSPIGFTMLPLGQRVVLWLRGGSKYGVWNSFGSAFSVKTASYNDGAGDPAITPQLARQFTYNPLKQWGRFGVPTPVIGEDATNKTYVDAGILVETNRAIAAEALLAPKNSPVFTGNPTAPTPAPGDNDTSVATTAFVAASFAPLASPALTGNPTAPTPAPGDNDTSLATTGFVTAAIAASAAAGADTPAVYPAAGATLTKGKINRINPGVHSVVLPVGAIDGESIILDASEAGVEITQGTAQDLVRMPGNGGSTIGVTGKTVIPPGFFGVLRFVASWFGIVVPVKAANPATLPTSAGRCVAISGDGKWLAVGTLTTPFIIIYDTSTGVPIKITDPVTLPTGEVAGICFSTDSRYLVCAHNTTPFVTIYDMATGVPVKLANPATLPGGNGLGASWSPDGQHFAIAHATTPFVTIYNMNSGAPVKITNPGTLPAGQGNGVCWSPDSMFLAVAHGTTPFVTIYSWETGSPVKITNPASLPAGTGQGCDWSPDGRYLTVVGVGATPQCSYDFLTGTPTKITAFTGPTGNAKGVIWSPSGRFMAISDDGGAPYLYIYDWITRVPVLMAAVATPPTGSPGFALAWSANERYLAIAHSTTPFLTIYDWASAVTNAWKLIPYRMPNGIGQWPVNGFRAFAKYLWYLKSFFR